MNHKIWSYLGADEPNRISKLNLMNKIKIEKIKNKLKISSFQHDLN